MWKFVFKALYLMPVVAWIVAVLAIVRPLKLGRRLSLLLNAVLAVALGKFVIFYCLGSNRFYPDLPPPVIWFLGWIYDAALLFTVFSVLIAVVDGVLRLCRHPVSVRAKRLRAALLAVVALAVSFYGTYSAVCIPSVKRVEIAFPNLPSTFDGYRIVHMSDLHCSTAARRGRFERIVARANDLAPDLVAITGDFVDGEVSDRQADLAPLAELRAKDGVVCCTGNHEVYSGWEPWYETFKGWGFVFPEETGVRLIRRGDDTLAIGGLPDPAFWGLGMEVVDAGNASKAFVGAPEGAFRVLLFHRPFTAAIESEAANVRLQLSGHTHGGAFPLVSALVARSNEGRTRGLYEFAKGRFLYLSPGTGQWAGYPLRLFNPTEITEIVLRSLSQSPNSKL